MRLALMIEGQEGVSWEDWLALAEACEQHGVEASSAPTTTSLASRPNPRGALDAWAVIPAPAARTERIELGTLVSPVTFRSPAVLANTSATASEISGGTSLARDGHRLDGGRARGVRLPLPPLKERLQLLHDQIEAVRGFWGNGPRATPDRRRQRPLRDARPSRFADEYNTVMATPEECAERAAGS